MGIVLAFKDRNPRRKPAAGEGEELADWELELLQDLLYPEDLAAADTLENVISDYLRHYDSVEERGGED